MLKIDSYSVKGSKLGTQLALPASLEGKDNPSLLAQAIHVYQDRSHTGLSKTKTRADVDRTKKKLYRQKGTGGARHGAKSAPIFVGGGTAHGPKGIRRPRVLPEKMRKQALSAVFSLKAKNKQLISVNGLSSVKKTKEGQAFLDKLGLTKAIFVLSDKNLNLIKILGNLRNVTVLPFKQLNAHNAFFGGTVILDSEIFEAPKKAVKAVKKETKK